MSENELPCGCVREFVKRMAPAINPDGTPKLQDGAFVMEEVEEIQERYCNQHTSVLIERQDQVQKALASGASPEEALKICSDDAKEAMTAILNEMAAVTKKMTALNNETTTITNEIPTRMNVVSILRDAHARLVAAAPDAPPALIAEKVVEVLREIATHAVEEFTRRTGQPFLWVDEPELPEDSEPLMSFGIEVKDGKGHVIF